MNTPTRLGLAALAVLALQAVPAAPAAAQSGPLSNFTQNPEADRRRDVRKPSALPGARGQVQAAPAERAPADLSPTEALFDAVNRGDMAAARDALGRGADVDGRNILGLTPLELAIDLGRNDLTFLLLSMRGAGSAASAPPPAARPGQRAAAPPPERPARVAAPAVVPGPVPQRQRQATADPGTPAPQAGFLGFGAPIR